MKEVRPSEVKQMINDKQAFRLIDVREPWEYELVQIEGAELIPLNEISKKVNQFDPGEKIVIHCHRGGRSAQACQILMEKGFQDVSNMVGGIDVWAQEVEPEMTRY